MTRAGAAGVAQGGAYFLTGAEAPCSTLHPPEQPAALVHAARVWALLIIGLLLGLLSAGFCLHLSAKTRKFISSTK